MKVLLNARQIEQILNKLAAGIVADTPKDVEIAVIGILSRGEIIAKRLAQKVSKKAKKEVPCGTLDITLYRDDLNSPKGSGQPRVRPSEIGFDIDDKIIVLVDDVLHTGRSTRAGMDALMDLGRPKAIRLAVLVERTGREVPIQADYAGVKTNPKPGELVHVLLKESDGKEQVTVE